MKLQSQNFNSVNKVCWERTDCNKMNHLRPSTHYGWAGHQKQNEIAIAASVSIIVLSSDRLVQEPVFKLQHHVLLSVEIEEN